MKYLANLENIDFLFGLNSNNSNKYIKSLIFQILFNFNDNLYKSITKIKEKFDEHIYIFLKFLIYIKLKNFNEAINIVDQYISSNFNEDYLFGMIIFLIFYDINLYNDIIFKDENKNIIIKSINLYKIGEYKKSYENLLLVKNNCKYKSLIDLMIIMNLIQTEFFEEANKKVLYLYKKNKNNFFILILLADLFVKKGDYIRAYKVYVKNFNYIIKNEKLRKNFLYISRKTNKMSHYLNLFLNYNKIINFSDDEIFEMGLFFHENGELNLAVNCYKKVDPKRFPVNKMLAIIGLQTNNFELFKKSIENEKNIRGEDFDLVKMNKLIFYSNLWES